MISYYDLLGLIKKGEQPKKIKQGNDVYVWEEYTYLTENGKNYLINKYEKDLFEKDIKIIEEKPKQVENIKVDNENIIDIDETGKHLIDTNRKDRNVYIPKINGLIDAVNYLLGEDKHE